VTVKARLALGAATGALLLLGSCGGGETSADLGTNGAAALDPDATVTADADMTSNMATMDSGVEGNEAEAEGHGHFPEVNESGAAGGGANGATTIATVPAGPPVDRLGQGPTVWIPPPPPPPPPPVVVFVPPPPVHGTEVRPPPVRPR
jgi:hypothetical protein